MTNLDSIFKSRDITLRTKVRLVKAMVFPVIIYECESWTVKKSESQRIDAFGLWCWRRLLRVPWTAERSNQSILKEISSGCSLEGMMLKLKLKYFGHLMRRVDSLEKTLMLGGIGGRRRRGRQRMRLLDGITDSMDMSLNELSGVFFNTTVQKHQFFNAQRPFWSNSHPYMTTRKVLALTRWTFVSKVMSMPFNMLFRFVIAFLSWSKCLFISWLQSPSAVILKPMKIKSITIFIVSPSICHEVI